MFIGSSSTSQFRCTAGGGRTGAARSSYSAERTPSVRWFQVLSALQNANHHEHKLARHPAFLCPPRCMACVGRIVFRGRWGEHPLAHVPLIGANQFMSGKFFQSSILSIGRAPECRDGSNWLFGRQGGLTKQSFDAHIHNQLSQFKRL
jgi:hypothetical protein